MTTFNFANHDGPLTYNSASGSYRIDFESEGVDFTMSMPVVTDNYAAATIFSGATYPGLGISLAAGSSALDVFRFEAEKGADNMFSGTALNPITLRAGMMNSLSNGTWQIQFLDQNGLPGVVKTVAAGTPWSISAVGQFSKIQFVPFSSGAVLTIGKMTATINCFLTGTMIATPTGEVAIETLKAGDQVLRADGSVTVVKWLGEQKISTRFQHPAKVNPIRISAGALGDNLPKRDLFVTADHALGLDGMLVNAGALVNGTTVTQVQKMPRDGFSYWHVETEGHELIVAEGCAVESYIDYVGRDGFDTATGEASAARIAEMPLPRISSARHLPQALAERLNPRLVA